jgi:hypothetical protein
VADSGCVGDDDEQPELLAERSGSPGAGEGRPYPFPPGPRDLDAWSRVLAVRPDLAPALTAEAEAQLQIRGVAHGISGGLARPPRTDAFRALGNAVVPAQAAVAFRELWRRLMR